MMEKRDEPTNKISFFFFKKHSRTQTSPCCLLIERLSKKNWTNFSDAQWKDLRLWARKK